MSDDAFSSPFAELRLARGDTALSTFVWELLWGLRGGRKGDVATKEGRGCLEGESGLWAGEAATSLTARALEEVWDATVAMVMAAVEVGAEVAEEEEGRGLARVMGAKRSPLDRAI
jgi:hypothetical protein